MIQDTLLILTISKVATAAIDKWVETFGYQSVGNSKFTPEMVSLLLSDKTLGANAVHNHQRKIEAAMNGRTSIQNFIEMPEEYQATHRIFHAIVRSFS